MKFRNFRKLKFEKSFVNFCETSFNMFREIFKISLILLSSKFRESNFDGFI